MVPPDPPETSVPFPRMTEFEKRSRRGAGPAAHGGDADQIANDRAILDQCVRGRAAGVAGRADADRVLDDVAMRDRGCGIRVDRHAIVVAADDGIADDPLTG